MPSNKKYLLPSNAQKNSEPGWLSSLFRKAVEEIEGSVMQDMVFAEAWRFTNLNAFKALEPIAANSTAILSCPKVFAELNALELHISNGILTWIDAVPEYIDLFDFADRRITPTWVIEAFGSTINTKMHPFTAINTTAFSGGVAMRIRKGAVMKKPIILLVDTQANGKIVAVNPRVLVVLEEDAVADLIEIHTGSGVYINNVVTELVIGKNSHISHYKLQAEDTDAFHIAMNAARCAANSIYDNFALSTGAKLSRNEISATLAGSHINYSINGSYLACSDQHMETVTFIDHVEPACVSHELYKGVLANHAQGVFQGKILVRKNAQQTKGYQMNRALLLSKEVEINSKPELEIYADDVTCSHGATVGELDEEQIFYLMARGISKKRARAIMVSAYVEETINYIHNLLIRDVFRVVANNWMQQNIVDTQAIDGS
ncbi:feS assembly protein SufD [Candidatus Endolissoclinum faulkneri L2]|uniref:FeS assembly protein SufD n=1 Tax=Candidatus Endolissoclinum faulkneri L2 TaxID=1193729 RepID=K7YPR2_9PROT|nr:Fe-S cluster assembly protein SufD [Candidatus Endolissoclinum faulkneri]AFX99512.1 feS assembly protein SufD [Candidatus Endolissoclinum faulkneri L2]